MEWEAERPPVPLAPEATPSLNTEEREAFDELTAQGILKPFAGEKRKRTGKKRVSFAIEDPRIALTDQEMRNDRDTYTARMQQLNAAKQAKLDEKKAQESATEFLKLMPTFSECRVNARTNHCVLIHRGAHLAVASDEPLGAAWARTAEDTQKKLGEFSSNAPTVVVATADSARPQMMTRKLGSKLWPPASHRTRALRSVRLAH